MKEKWNQFKSDFSKNLVNFMSSRYGADHFYNTVLIIAVILLIINLFAKSAILNIVIIAALLYNSYRAFSKDYTKRNSENQKFLQLTKPVRSWFRLQKRRMNEKEYAFKKCPECKTTIRLPKQKGSHTVKCPKCGEEFKVRI